MVNAAIPPFRTNKEIIEGGRECISGIDLDRNASPFDVILAIMSIAKYYYSDLQVIRLTPDVSDMNIKDELMDNIRVIVVRLLHSPTFVRDINLDDMARKFLFKNNRASSSTASSDNNIESDVTCFRSILSFYYDENNFTDQLFDGIDIVHTLMKDDNQVSEDDPRWTLLNKIISRISRRRLRTVNYEFAKYFVVKYDRLMNENNRIDSDTE